MHIHGGEKTFHFFFELEKMSENQRKKYIDKLIGKIGIPLSFNSIGSCYSSVPDEEISNELPILIATSVVHNIIFFGDKSKCKLINFCKLREEPMILEECQNFPWKHPNDNACYVKMVINSWGLNEKTIIFT
jgi:hypothetical protein